MSDRELLELAAKAAGLKLIPFEQVPLLDEEGQPYWNPLEDDGDALRLAVQLRIPVLFHPAQDITLAGKSFLDPRQRAYHWALYGGGMAATRRAIVEEAVEIGRKNLRYRK